MKFAMFLMGFLSAGIIFSALWYRIYIEEKWHLEAFQEDVRRNNEQQQKEASRQAGPSV